MGGPVLDGTGSVLGVVTLKTTRQEGLAFCVPAEDLSKAISVAEALGSRLPPNPGARSPPPILRIRLRPHRPGPRPPAPGGVPDLVYGWKAGETYAYEVALELDTTSGTVEFQGNSIYRVKAADDEEVMLSHRGWMVTRCRARMAVSPPEASAVPRTPDDVVELQLDRKGGVVNANGSSPLPLLGDLSMLMIEPLPDGAHPAWEESQTITLNEIEKIPGSNAGTPGLGRPDLRSFPSSRSRLRSRLPALFRLPPPLPAPAPPPQVKVTGPPGSGADGLRRLCPAQMARNLVSISKTYELVTQEIVGEEPRLKMTGNGTIQFDVKTGIPVSVTYKLLVVENTTNITVRVPLSLPLPTVDRAEEQERALRPPVMPPTPRNPIDQAELNKLASDMKSGDVNRARAACRTLADAAPIEENRGDVARLLERLLTAQDEGLRGDAVLALGIPGDSLKRRTSHRLSPERGLRGPGISVRRSRTS